MLEGVPVRETNLVREAETALAKLACQPRLGTHTRAQLCSAVIAALRRRVKAFHTLQHICRGAKS